MIPKREIDHNSNFKVFSVFYSLYFPTSSSQISNVFLASTNVDAFLGFEFVLIICANSLAC